MKLNKLSLSLAITLALGSTFGMAHAETTATATKAPVATSTKASTHAAAQKAEAPAKAKEVLPAGVYPDTKDNWARDAIQAMTEAGYLSGYADNTFRPSKSITREQAATIYSKVLQHNMNEQELADLVTKENGISYTDIENDRWSNTAIKLVGAAGVMEGTTKTTFTPSKAMDREEFVASAANLVKKIKPDTPVKFEKVTFKDGASISKAYVADIEYMAQRGYVASGATTDFNPSQPVTRAQAATILNRILNGETAPVPSKATAIKDDVKQDAKKVENKTKTVEKDVEKDAKADAKKAKADAKKAEAAAKADAKKLEKEAKANKADKISESKVEQAPRIVRPVRRSTLKPLDQKQQDALENSVFTQLNKTYKTPEAFQDYGVMYWRDNQLHVALKSSADMDTVKANLASQGNSTINNYVVVEPSQYSQTEYDVIESNFRNYYSKNEKGGNVIAIFPDVENNQLYAVVSTASKETQQGISKVFGSKVKMTVKR
ncbi:S-layer homology domain-containing protein [Veillonella sp.]